MWHGSCSQGGVLNATLALYFNCSLCIIHFHLHISFVSFEGKPRIHYQPPPQIINTIIKSKMYNFFKDFYSLFYIYNSSTSRVFTAAIEQLPKFTSSNYHRCSAIWTHLRGMLRVYSTLRV